MCQMPRIAAPRAFSLTSVSLSVLASRARMRRAVTLSCVLARGMILVGVLPQVLDRSGSPGTRPP